MKNVLEWLENCNKECPEKDCCIDEVGKKSFSLITENSKRIGSFLIDKIENNNAIIVFCDKNSKCVESMFGAMYAGCFYVVIDVNSPNDRIEKIYEVFDKAVVIAEDNFILKAKEVSNRFEIYSYEDAIKTDIDDNKLLSIREKTVDKDPAYVLFTSGSTGIPKGTVISHQSLISYINWVSKEFDFNRNTIFGSQTPLYFSMSVSDLYSTIKCGCTYCMIPKSLFMFPLNLVEYLNENKINTIYWVPTAISIMSNWKVFDVSKPEYLQKVLFAGEVMPTKQLNYWIKNFKDVKFANLFGPTETTDICTFYVVNREFKDNESVPIGKHCDNCNVFIIKEDGTLAKDGEEGELYVRGSFVADGYYNNIEKTEQVFVQNPLNKAYPERVYKTGDIVKYNDLGELIYITRKDFQIKRNGYRIEMGEIEANANSIDGIKECVCVYDKETDCLALVYEGHVKKDKILELIRSKVPAYMVPDRVIKMVSLPKNQNGKINRKYLSSNLSSLEN